MFIEEVTTFNRVAGKYVNLDLMKNNYGNYVVQKALNLAPIEQKNHLIGSIANNIEQIGDRKLILKWQSIIGNHLELNNCRSKKNFNTVEINYDRSLIFPSEYKRAKPRFNTNDVNFKSRIVNNNEYMK
jgi:hypothetical protein